MSSRAVRGRKQVNTRKLSLAVAALTVTGVGGVLAEHPTEANASAALGQNECYANGHCSHFHCSSYLTPNQQCAHTGYNAALTGNQVRNENGFRACAADKNFVTTYIYCANNGGLAGNKSEPASVTSGTKGELSVWGSAGYNDPNRASLIHSRYWYIPAK